jgi:hypothetical protein
MLQCKITIIKITKVLLGGKLPAMLGNMHGNRIEITIIKITNVLLGGNLPAMLGNIYCNRIENKIKRNPTPTPSI